MNDVEHDLRELFERQASSVGGVAPKLPDRVRTRGRRRQLRTALVSGVTVLAVIAGSVGVLRAVGTDRDRQPTPADDPWAGYEVFERTAAVGNFTITSPSDWYLVNQLPWARRITPELRKQRERAVETCDEEPSQDERQACRSSLIAVPGDGLVVPLLMLGNMDRGLESSPCFDPSFSIAPDEAVMTIALDQDYFAANFGAGDRARWPVPFDTPPADDRPSCGPGTYVYFAAGDIPYVAHFSIGDTVPEDERRTLIHAFEGMAVDDGQDFLVERSKPDDASTYIIAGGENAAGPWTLELGPQTDPGYITNVQLQLSTVDGSGVRAGGPFTISEGKPIEQAGGDPVFGAVVKGADAVELRLEEGTPAIPAQIVPLPPSMPFDFDLFFASNDSDVPATAVVTGREKALSPPSPANPAIEGVDRVATGTTGGVDWTLEYVGGIQLALVNRQHDIFESISGNLLDSLGPDNPVIMGVYDFGNPDHPRYLLFGIARSDVAQLSVAIADDETETRWRDQPDDSTTLGDGSGSWAWWTELPPGPVSARVAAFDEGCHRLQTATLSLHVNEPTLPDRATCVVEG